MEVKAMVQKMDVSEKINATNNLNDISFYVYWM